MQFLLQNETSCAVINRESGIEKVGICSWKSLGVWVGSLFFFPRAGLSKHLLDICSFVMHHY